MDRKQEKALGVLDARDGDTVRVVYQSSEGGSSATLGTWEGPSA